MIWDYTYNELLEFNIGSGEKMPLLSQVVSLARSRGVYVYVNMNLGPNDRESIGAYIGRVVGSVLSNGYQQSSYIVCSDPEVSTLLKSNNPAMRVGLLFPRPVDDVPTDDVKTAWAASWDLVVIHEKALTREVMRNFGLARTDIVVYHDPGIGKEDVCFFHFSAGALLFLIPIFLSICLHFI
jgi:hypothetical protein